MWGRQRQGNVIAIYAGGLASDSQRQTGSFWFASSQRALFKPFFPADCISSLKYVSMNRKIWLLLWQLSLHDLELSFPVSLDTFLVAGLLMSRRHEAASFTGNGKHCSTIRGERGGWARKLIMEVQQTHVLFLCIHGWCQMSDSAARNKTKCTWLFTFTLTGSGKTMSRAWLWLVVTQPL